MISRKGKFSRGERERERKRERERERERESTLDGSSGLVGATAVMRLLCHGLVQERFQLSLVLLFVASRRCCCSQASDVTEEIKKTEKKNVREQWTSWTTQCCKFWFLDKIWDRTGERKQEHGRVCKLTSLSTYSKLKLPRMHRPPTHKTLVEYETAWLDFQK